MALADIKSDTAYMKQSIAGANVTQMLLNSYKVRWYWLILLHVPVVFVNTKNGIL